MNPEAAIRDAELMQLLLLDSLYALSGSEHVVFQGGTAIRWIHGGMRFSEDLDFVTHLPSDSVQGLLTRLQAKVSTACIAQFGPGMLEQTPKGKRADAVKTFFIFRPEDRRGRIAVKMEFEKLAGGHGPETENHVLRDLSSVAGIIASGMLAMTYSSSIVVAETAEQLLADKVRAIFERRYLKGRDIYDIWWLRQKAGVLPSWECVRETFSLYRTAFTPARPADYFNRKTSQGEIIQALRTDLSRFIPASVFRHYESQGFAGFIDSVNQVTRILLDQGMKAYLKRHGQ
jgi:hypothetical protein